MRLFGDKQKLPAQEDALPGRSAQMPVAPEHFVLGSSMTEAPADAETALFGMGCFWGAERKFWEAPGVISTAVGYAAGHTPNPTYEEVCTGRTGHNEVVKVCFDPRRTSYEDLLRIFWENHDPTQGMQQGNDRGTQYRSGIYATTPAQLAAAERSRAAFATVLAEAGHPEITTEIVMAPPFYYAEDYHQQYLAKVPNGYCGLGGTGLRLPVEAPEVERTGTG